MKYQVSATGIAWFANEHIYEAAMAVMADADELPDTYLDWLRQAKAAEDFVRRNGGVPVRAYIEPGKFAEWCRLRGHNVDAHARMCWGSEFAHEWLQDQ